MNKSFVHKVNCNGRLAIPKEIRRNLAIKLNDPLEVRIEELSGKRVVILKKYCQTCVFCDTTDDCIKFKGKLICRKCLAEIDA